MDVQQIFEAAGDIGGWLEDDWGILEVNVDARGEDCVERTVCKVKGAVCLLWRVCGSLLNVRQLTLVVGSLVSWAVAQSNVRQLVECVVAC